jgi:RND family efflux transporter MFP subunit
MKRLNYLLFLPLILLASCGGGKKADTKAPEVPKTDSIKSIPVAVLAVQPIDFHGYVDVQSQIVGDENILATPKAPGTVSNILVQVGQHVSSGQVLATLDAAVVNQQIEAMQPQLDLYKSVYEKQQALWKQNIGTEVQLMQAKAQYEATQKQIESMKTQRDFYRIVSPINGIVDAVNLKVGEMAAPGMNGIRVVSYDKLKAEASLGENYLGKVKQGDPVILVLSDENDSIKTTLTYVSQAIDPVSRAFTVLVRLGNNNKLHPNMACEMKIGNYENPHALVVPVSVIQKTQEGTMLYIASGGKAKSVMVTTGRNSNGQVEILSGLNEGDQVIVKGYEGIDNGQTISIQ